MLKSLNRVIKILIISDLVLLFGWGLLSPIFAIFIVENIKGGDTQVVGIGVGIYWILQSLFMLPIGWYLDKKQGEKDDYYFLVGGMLLGAFVPLALIFVNLPWHIYVLQAFHALATAMINPSWCGIFTRHIDKGKEAQSWALDSCAVGIGAGTAGIIGGTVVKFFGFIPLFVGVAIFGTIAALLCFLIKNNLLPKDKGGIIVFPKPH